jgi:hypothetical protein
MRMGIKVMRMGIKVMRMGIKVMRMGIKVMRTSIKVMRVTILIKRIAYEMMGGDTSDKPGYTSTSSVYVIRQAQYTLFGKFSVRFWTRALSIIFLSFTQKPKFA